MSNRITSSAVPQPTSAGDDDQHQRLLHHHCPHVPPLRRHCRPDANLSRPLSQ